MELIPHARAISDNATSGTSNDVETLRATVASAIITAAGLGLRTCTASISGKAGASVLNIIKTLSQLAYRYTISGTTLTITWA